MTPAEYEQVVRAAARAKREVDRLPAGAARRLAYNMLMAGFLLELVPPAVGRALEARARRPKG